MSTPMSDFYTNVKVWGNKVLLRHVRHGRRHDVEVHDWQPRLFIPSKKEAEFKSIEGKPLAEMKFGNIKEAKEFAERYQGVDNFEIYGNTEWKYQYLADAYKGEVKFDSSLISIGIIDLEVNSSNGFPEPKYANEKITAITLRLNGNIYTWSYKDYTSKEENRWYIKCNSEAELLRSFLNRWKNECPDIISGWNVKGFDIPYLVNRMVKVFGGPEQMKDLSPWRIVQERTSRIRFAGRDVEQQTYEIAGVEVVDYIDAYKKFVLKPRESYKLGYIAQVELGDDKIAYDEDEGLHGLYDADFETFIDYNIKDVELVHRLDEKLKLFELVIFLAYNSKVNYSDVFSQVRMWDALIYNELLRDNVIVPQKKETVKDTKYEGAYVKEPQIGFHRYVSSFDVEGLYPALFIAFNISPETLVPYASLPDDVRNWYDEYSFGPNNVDRLLEGDVDTSILKKHGLSMAANGQFFRTDIEGFMPRIVKRLKMKRKSAKTKMLAIEQEIDDIESELRKRKT